MGEITHGPTPREEFYVISDYRERENSFPSGMGSLIDCQVVRPGHMYVQLMLNGLSKLHIHVCIYARVTILMKEFVAGRDT